jgi:hypothetical protein
LVKDLVAGLGILVVGLLAIETAVPDETLEAAELNWAD